MLRSKDKNVVMAIYKIVLISSLIRIWSTFLAQNNKLQFFLDENEELNLRKNIFTRIEVKAFPRCILYVRQ